MLGTCKHMLALAAVVGTFLMLQLVPYGRDHSKPPAGALVAWDSPQTQDLARRACFNCHSNETQWPWYSTIAPVSWRIQQHVDEGRKTLDFTAFDPGNKDVAKSAGEAGETVSEGEMPPRDYLLLHPEARLSPAEQTALAQGLNATFTAFAEGEEKASRSSGADLQARRADAEERGEVAEHKAAERGSD